MDKKGIMVLGMHRSGTSALGGLLSACGVSMGANQIPPANDNVKGFFEDAQVLRVNELLLGRTGMPGSWDSVLMLDNDWLHMKEVRALLPEAAEVIQEEYDGSAIIGLKDPRLCHFVPFWQQALRLAGYETLVISIHRNPLEIAASLASRDGLSVSRSVLLWARHVLDMERGSRQLKRCFVSYDGLLDGPQKVLAEIQSSLGIIFPRSFQESKKEIRAFVSGDLKHHQSRAGDLDGFPGAIVRLNALMEQVASRQRPDDDSFRKELDSIYREQEFWLAAASMSHWGLYEQRPRLYLDSGSGFSEKECIKASRLRRDGSLIVADFTVEREGVAKVRLDPVEGCWVRIAPVDAAAYLADGTKRALDWNTAVTNKSRSNGDWWTFATTDPTILWDPGAPVTRVSFAYYQDFYSLAGLYELATSEVGNLLSETNRLSTDVGRLSAEANCLSAEANRLSAEANRLTAELHRQTQASSRQREELEAQHVSDMNRLSAEIDRLRKDCGSLTAETESLHRTSETLEGERAIWKRAETDLNRILRSRSYKLGRLLTAPVRLARRIVGKTV